VSSYEVLLNLLLKIPPDEVLFDFLAQCGLPLRFRVVDMESRAYEALLLAAAIERAPSPVRDCILASMRHVALLADEAGLDALRAVNEAYGSRVSALHLPDAPAQCALWMYLRHRDLFDEALRARGLQMQRHETMPLDALRQPLSLPDALIVDSVRLCEATLLDEATGGEIAIKAPEGDSRTSVLDLLDHWMPTENPMRKKRFRMVSAKLGVEFFPEPGQAVGRSVVLALKRRGGSNLAELDASTRAQFEAWMNHWRLTPAHEGNAVPSLPTTV
jgi:hypothetical protein